MRLPRRPGRLWVSAASEAGPGSLEDGLCGLAVGAEVRLGQGMLQDT